MVGFVLVWFAMTSVYSIKGCLSFSLPLTDHLRSKHICPISTRQSSVTTVRLGTNVGEDGFGFASGANDVVDIGLDVDVDILTKDCNSEMQNKKNINGNNNVGLYIHIPYCRQRCRYCDFAIVPIGDQGSDGKSRSTNSTLDLDTGNSNQNGDQSSDRDDSQLSRREQGFRRMNNRYVSAIVAELKYIAAQHNDGKNTRQKIPLKSVYFGGGTPSLAPIESIQEILHHACGLDNPEAPFRLLQQRDHEENVGTGTTAATTEITMEMDPGTFDRDHLTSLRALGINRVSLGVQSFDDDLLVAMGRTHRRVDVLQAIRDIASVFGEKKEYNSNDITRYDNVNYSIDLISGCPGLTPAKWVETLQEATAGIQTKKTTSSTVEKETATAIASTTNKEQKQTSLLLSSLPPPKHISVYDMQIEEGTVFGKWAAKAKVAAATKGKDGDQITATSNEDGTDDCNDDDDDASRKFTVVIPVDSRQQNLNKEQRILRLPTEAECAFMYKYAAGYLRAKNYEHYEVSSYAAFDDNKKDKNIKHENNNSNKRNIHSTSKRSRHNQIYWEYGGQWHAVGLGATSFVNKKLVARPREMSDYLNWVVELEDPTTSNANKQETTEDEEEDMEEDFLSDLLLKRMRTIDGLDLTWLESHYGSEVVKNVLEGAKLGLELGLAERTEDNILRLADPDGLLYSNFIISSIFVELGYT
eukprot:CAMPEP_0168194882 /NCGR_PEP_ID=MMETSP0139_2-20121125/19491_1 /TAXON_ID=44445 /ORGANISM="Pseudo-nitzschia australis, Strain 10249 10 AB" /LENGTH=697 /DNA_ID=CAMNT_0008118563 /DNA_START=144 /DNA_END=2237 /DNA_ORIENTATION=+